MRGVATSYLRLFGSPGSGPIDAVEIPDFQRDYAQGRPGAAVQDMRDRFLDVLHDAVTTGPPVGLDFVYGEVSDGTLRPLDGQQRLTTLFLLHWYLAFRTGRLPTDDPWTAFTYATRPSARRFCERLTTAPPPVDTTEPATWLFDQPWFRYSWRHDPTIQSMMTMVEAIDRWFAATDHESAWQRLSDAGQPAVTFHLLPIDDMGPVEVLYVTMNSRGKPLTEFEVLKARLEQVVNARDPERAARLASKLDGAWTDLLWPLRGDDDVIDDEMLRYLSHLVEVCEWREGRADEGRLAQRLDRLLAPDNPRAEEYLDLIESSVDCWGDAEHEADVFDSLFAMDRDAAAHGKVRLFGARAEVDLWRRCLRTHGAQTGAFSLGDSLMLHAVTLHQRRPVEEFVDRLRALRNLVEASENAIRRPSMPSLIAETESLVMTDDLHAVRTFSPAQVADEQRKRRVLATRPTLRAVVHRLEEHPLLRGGLMAFDLDDDAFPQRAAAFERVFDDPTNWEAVTGALLATGEYQRPRGSGSYQLGTSKPQNEGVWRQLFTGPGKDQLAGTRPVLATFLDEVAASDAPVPQTLARIQQEFLDQRVADRHFDWRYYLVRYPCMRQGASGIYWAGQGGQMGYDLAMLRRTQLNSYYRDPYLLAVWVESGAAYDPAEPVVKPWFYGYETEGRWLTLNRSGVGLRAVERGFEIRPPGVASAQRVFDALLPDLGVDENLLLAVPQDDATGALVDSSDRLVVAAELVRRLTTSGL